MRDDEEFVISSVARFYSGTWRPGENPPDAYLDIDGEAIAIEISMLTQHITTHLGTRERLSDDQTAVRLADNLNIELKDSIPDGKTVGLVLRPPIARFRKTKNELSRAIVSLVSNPSAGGSRLNVCGNDVALWITQHDSPDYKKVSAVIYNPNSSSNILKNAVHALEDRIQAKAKKCRPLASTMPIWLALLNDYWLADAHAYGIAMRNSSITHPFERILMVSGDRSVTVLFPKT